MDLMVLELITIFDTAGKEDCILENCLRSHSTIIMFCINRPHLHLLETDSEILIQEI